MVQETMEFWGRIESRKKRWIGICMAKVRYVMVKNEDIEIEPVVR